MLHAIPVFNPDTPDFNPQDLKAGYAADTTRHSTGTRIDCILSSRYLDAVRGLGICGEELESPLYGSAGGVFDCQMQFGVELVRKGVYPALVS